MTLAFVLKYWKDFLLGAAIIALVVSCQIRDDTLRQKGIAEERARRADSTLAALKPQVAHADTVFVQDTVRFLQLATRYDTVRDTVLKHLTDTAYVDRFVTVADSTIHACSDLLGSCRQKALLAQQEIDALNAKLAAVPVIAKRSCVVPAVVAGGLGLLGGVLIHR